MKDHQPLSEPHIATYESEELSFEDAYTQNYFMGRS